MDRESAERRAEQYVYCELTFGEILYFCNQLGIKTMRKGRVVSRAEMETQLIEHLTNKFMEAKS